MSRNDLKKKKERGKEITTVIHKLICLRIFCLFLCMKKVDTKIIFFVASFSINDFFRRYTRLPCIFGFQQQWKFFETRSFDRSAEGLWPQNQTLLWPLT